MGPLYHPVDHQVFLFAGSGDRRAVRPGNPGFGPEGNADQAAGWPRAHHLEPGRHAGGDHRHPYRRGIRADHVPDQRASRRLAQPYGMMGKRSRRSELGREAEMHDVAVGDHVFLAFQSQFAGLARARLAAMGDVVVIADGFRADETALEVRVDDTCGLRPARAAGHGPRPRLLRTGGEVGDEVEQRVAGANETIEARLLEPYGFEGLGPPRRREPGELRFALWPHWDRP